MKEKDAYPGKRIGHLTLISRTRVPTKNYGNRWQWLCKCDCGNLCYYYTFQIGMTPSRKGYIDCGKHKAKKISSALGGIQKKSIDKLSDSNPKSVWNSLYRKWYDMHSRCNNPHNEQYSNYGERGIRVCKEWSDYNTFKSWAIKIGYNPKIKGRNVQTLDRINVNGNYEPNNCRFVDVHIQNNNKRDNVYITKDGITKTMMEWCKELNLSYPTVNTRYRKGIRGSDLLKPPNLSTSPKHIKKYRYKGKEYSIPQLSKLTGISGVTLRKRIRKGMNMSDVVKKSNRTHSYKERI